MPQDHDEPDTAYEAVADEQAPRYPVFGRRKLVLLALLLIICIALAYGWFTRERIADDLIASELDALGIPATYEIESIGPGRQVLKNLVFGDPEGPDLTIERLSVETELRFGLPGIGQITAVKPRLFGTYRNGNLSFGSLDPVIFAESEEPAGLPDYDIAIIDGRALMETDYGPVGVKAEGKGHLRGGFEGTLAAVAPELSVSGCKTGKATIYGDVSVSKRKPRFSGPLRHASLECRDAEVLLSRTNFALDVTGDETLDGLDADIGLNGAAARIGDARLASSSGSARLTFRKDLLTARYDLEASGIATPQAAAGKLGVEGRVRALDNFARLEVEGDVSGEAVGLGDFFKTSLAALAEDSQGSLVSDLASALQSALKRESRGSSLAGSFLLRKTGEVFSVVIPRASLRGGSGESLLALSRIQLRAGGSAQVAVSGNFTTGGRGLPRIAGRMERGGSSPTRLHVRMPEYRAGSARLSLPRLLVVQTSAGGIGFAGEARVSGALPGGRADNLAVPLDGNWSERGGLALWRRCTDLRFDRLELSGLSLTKRAIKVCPSRAGAIVRSGPDGFRIAGGIPGLDLTGLLGETPVHIRSGAVGLAWPGQLAARDVDVVLGPADTASHFTISRIDAGLGSETAGTFADADVRLDAVPLDVLDAAGKWRFSDGRLLLSDSVLRVEDREQVDRFQPLVARDATLELVDNRIVAEALLREPKSDREIVRAEIRHDLAAGAGNSDLFIDGILFDQKLQPDEVSRLALGVIANASGVIRGTGRIDWDETDVTSTGQFSTDWFDFAAAFGPVQGVSGTIRFTDLLGLVTAPDQRLTIAGMNPGIEVNDGVLIFDIKPDYILAVDGATWPFLGGKLHLEPATMAIGTDDPLRYSLTIEGLDAARFLEQMELDNLSATGTFDGTMPLVFNEEGGFIEGGLLTSRPPGGNVSYVGELTYEDLSTMANFAFDALRSLNYREMTIAMDGAIDGEMVTRVKFGGVKQGEGATSNFLTRRISRLPIQFNVNLRAPFYQLITSVKSFYDPEYVRDPRTLGLIEQNAPQPAIQPSESGNM